MNKLDAQKKQAEEWLIKHGVKHMIPEAMEKIEKDYKRRKNINYLIVIFIILSLISFIIINKK